MNSPQSTTAKKIPIEPDISQKVLSEENKQDNVSKSSSTTTLTSSLKESSLKDEIRLLKSQLKGMEILLKQNAALEKEVERLCTQLDEASKGVQKKGYLYKWREREIYYAPKWGLRYFVLNGNKLSYYGDEHEQRPRRTINLSKCFIKEEGTKKGGLYHVFGIYIRDESLDTDTLLLKLSSESAAESIQWIDMLEQACALEGNEGEMSEESSPVPSRSPASPFKEISSTTTSSKEEKDKSDESTPVDIDANLDPNDKDLFSTVMLTRVKSATMVLKRSQSRSGLGLRKSLPNDFTVSGTKLSNLVDLDVKKQKEKDAKKKDSHKPAAKSFPAYKPMHIANASSPLSTETRPGEYNFRGFFNLGVIILVLTHCDLIVNNIKKYGFKFNFASFVLPPEAVITAGDISFETSAILFHFSKAIATWFLSILLNYTLEKIASKVPNLSERFMLGCNFLVGTFNIVLPCYWVWTSKAHPGANLLYMFQSVIIWMKLISYAHANKDLRIASRRTKKLDRENSNGGLRSGYSSGDELALATDNNAKPFSGEQYANALSEVKNIESPFLLYPQNLTLLNLGYFLIVPTLCYQLNYPRAEKIKWDKLLLIIFRLLLVAFAMLFAIEQYIKPTLETAVIPMQNGDILGILERLLKLSIPNTYVWLLVFYFYFHLWLNLLAEITRFGDRLFYKDWWNAKTIDRYWLARLSSSSFPCYCDSVGFLFPSHFSRRTWNLPVHHWVTRHLCKCDFPSTVSL
jgi:hypothetical protein